VNTPLATAINLYEKENYDFHKLLTWHLAHGIVFCDSECFAMGYPCVRDAPETPVLRDQADTLFVTMCAGDMRKGLSQFACEFKFISFQRTFKGSERVRTFPMIQFFKRLQIGYGI
jgi:hypothetical protein